MTDEQRDEIRRRVAAERAEQGLAPEADPESDAVATLAAVAARVNRKAER